MKRCSVLVKGIVHCEDKYLILAKWYDDRIMDPYQWQFVDGAVEFGESPDMAVHRLIEEQTGLMAEIESILYTWSFTIEDTHKVGIAYICVADAHDTIMLSEDINEARWVTREELSEYIDNPVVIEDLERAEL
jgi:ADP-ribose pyrophosphatase YjhB (NUDIX family)